MSCFYLYKGHQFNSEIELDDFILEKERFISKYKDIVFSKKSTGAMESMKILDEESELVKQIRAGKTKIFSEDGTQFKYEYPYVGVNQYVASFKNDEGDAISTYFDLDNYWNKRFEQWKLPRDKEGNGGLNDIELELFFDNDTDRENAKNNGITDQMLSNGKTKFQNYREQMEHKWEIQCLTGDAIHSVFQYYFSKAADVFGEAYVKSLGYSQEDAKTVRMFDVIENSDALQELRKKLSVEKYAKKDGKGYMSFEELLNPSQIKSTFDRCAQLRDKITNQFGKDVEFYPEFEISGKVNTPFNDDNHTNVDQVLGIIDLLVLDKDGVPHIYDYKTSLKTYDEFPSPKKLAFRYQIGLYGRILAQKGLNVDEDSLYNIVPIQMKDFKPDYKGNFTFSTVEFDPLIIRNEDYTLRTKEYFVKNLDQIIPIPERKLTTDELITKTLEVEQELFPGYNQFKTYDDEIIKQELERDEALKGPDPDSGLWRWKPKGGMGREITAKSDTELIKKAKEWRNGLKSYTSQLTKQVKNATKKGILDESVEEEFARQNINDDKNANQDWFKINMKQYCNSNWKVCDGPEYKGLEELGIIILKNIYTGQRDIIKISTSDFYYNIQFGQNRNTLAGAFQPDIYYQSRQNDLMLSSARGNIELMEATIVANQLKSEFKGQGILGEIKVMDPVNGYGVSASNAELMYTFNELVDQAQKKGKLEGFVNNFKEGNIKVASKAHIVRTLFHDIMEISTQKDFGDIYAQFRGLVPCQTRLDEAIDGTTEEKIKALEELLTKLKSPEDSKNKYINVAYEQGQLSQPHIKLYNQILLAIAELKGYNFRQQLNDHKKWIESLLFVSKGIHGTQFDNPGNLKSETLNLLTKLVTEAYQNVRQDIQDPAAKLRMATEKLKQSKSFNWFVEHTTGNEADLFKNLYREDQDDLIFKNPWQDNSLTPEEKEYLIAALEYINKDRLGRRSDTEIENMKRNDDYDYFKVPLARGDGQSRSSQRGLLNMFKDKLRGLLPKEILKRAKEKAEGIKDRLYDTESQRQRESSENLYEMNNIFDDGNLSTKTRRKEFIAKRGGRGYFETNLENLTLKHIFAYSMKKRVDSIMPTIKAAVIHLSLQGAMHNTKFENDIEYAEKYIKNKIKNESIIDPKYQMANEYAQKLKGAASTLTLMFSPVQLIGQTIQGLWNDISLMFRSKSFAGNPFSFKHMLKSAKIIYSQLFKSTLKPTVPKLLNELYGVNDMDMNTYIDKLKSDQHGIHNFTNFMYKFASRPDFYNRMLIFTSKMVSEGCYEAHSVDSNGKLVYNWKLDKRFELYANGRNKGSKEYKQQEALYHAMAKQFILEHASNPDGTEFKMGDALPRAYTNLEAESMKSLSDTIYGYYSHEKKSMIQSTLIGGMWMQFRTYWSGKKNQWFAGGSVKLEGRWKQYEENGQKYYYQVDPDGTIRYDLPPTTEETIAPFMRWEGDWKEGMMKTCWDLIKAIKHDGLTKGWDSMWNHEDINIRNAYRSNLKQSTFDLTMMLVLGPLLSKLLSELFKDADADRNKQDMGDGFIMAAENVALKSVQYSYLDFNFIKSIGEPTMEWTPFAMSYYSNLLSRAWNTAMNEDKSNWNILVNSTAATRATKPFWDALITDPSET